MESVYYVWMVHGIPKYDLGEAGAVVITHTCQRAMEVAVECGLMIDPTQFPQKLGRARQKAEEVVFINTTNY